MRMSESEVSRDEKRKVVEGDKENNGFFPCEYQHHRRHLHRSHSKLYSLQISHCCMNPLCRSLSFLSGGHYVIVEISLLSFATCSTISFFHVSLVGLKATCRGKSRKVSRGNEKS